MDRVLIVNPIGHFSSFGLYVPTEMEEGLRRRALLWAISVISDQSICQLPKTGTLAEVVPLPKLFFIAWSPNSGRPWTARKSSPVSHGLTCVTEYLRFCHCGHMDPLSLKLSQLLMNSTDACPGISSIHTNKWNSQIATDSPIYGTVWRSSIRCQ